MCPNYIFFYLRALRDIGVRVIESWLIYVYTGCNGTEPADVLFILDASGSVGTQNFNLMLNFVKKLVDGFPVSATETQIGVITFDSKVYLQFHLNKYHTKTDIKNAVSHIRWVSNF